MEQLIILAGGTGTRLKDRLGDLPKPMIPVGGKPLLEHHVELARAHGFTEVLMFVHHRAELIRAHFGDGWGFGVTLRYIIEAQPLGTAGAVLAGFEQLADNFVVMYGDTMANVDLGRFYNTHKHSNADATLFLHPNNHPFDSDLVETNSENWITAFHNRPHPVGRWFQNLVNAGLYVIEKRALTPPVAHPQPLDFGQDLFPAMLERGAKLHGYNSPEFIKDIGTPQRYDHVCAQYDAGIIQRSSLSTPQRAVFIDRDGTLIKEVSIQGLHSPDQLELLPGVAAAIQALNQAGLRAILVTNQPVVAKGFCTESDIQQIHNKLETLLGREHAFLDRIYYCPHHPQSGFAGERRELKVHCDCRKPEIGLIRKSVAELNIDLAQSWLIGDSTTDLQTAKNAGVRAILVRTGAAGNDGKYGARPDYTFDALDEAVRFIVESLARDQSAVK